MERNLDLAGNKIYHLENSVIMYSIHNAETVEKMINTIQKIHSKTAWNETLLSARLDIWYKWYLSEQVAPHYAINSILYLNTLKGKYI